MFGMVPESKMTATGAMRQKVATKRGLQLCLMLIGRASVGKSTFINTLCDKKALPVDVSDTTNDGTAMRLVPHHVEMRDGEDNVVINLDIIESSGFGDMINNEDCPDDLVKYLEAQFDNLLKERNQIQRNPKFNDTCVHVALYFLDPTGGGLQPLDIDTMIAMSARVNVIPVIAKADTLTSREIATSKKLIMNDIREHNIQIFDFPYDEEDDEAREQCEHLRSLLPFTIIGAKDNRQRVYPWGTFNVDDTSLCDFVVLKSVLFGSHFEELRDITYNKHYEKYRTNKLRQDLGIKGPEALYSDLYDAISELCYISKDWQRRLPKVKELSERWAVEPGQQHDYHAPEKSQPTNFWTHNDESIRESLRGAHGQAKHDYGVSYGHKFGGPFVPSLARNGPANRKFIDRNF